MSTFSKNFRNTIYEFRIVSLSHVFHYYFTHPPGCFFFIKSAAIIFYIKLLSKEKSTRKPPCICQSHLVYILYLILSSSSSDVLLLLLQIWIIYRRAGIVYEIFTLVYNFVILQFSITTLRRDSQIPWTFSFYWIQTAHHCGQVSLSFPSTIMRPRI